MEGDVSTGQKIPGRCVVVVVVGRGGEGGGINQGNMYIHVAYIHIFAVILFLSVFLKYFVRDYMHIVSS